MCNLLIVYLQGTFLLSKAVSQHIVENKIQSGSIINISSIVGKVSPIYAVIDTHTVFGRILANVQVMGSVIV